VGNPIPRKMQMSFNLYLVRQMVSILSENPIAKEEDLVFPKSNIYLFNFLNEDGTRAANTANQ